VPELPDVEDFRRQLAEHAVGRTVQNVEVADAGVLHGVSPQGLGQALTHRRITEPARHGKWLTVCTDGPSSLLVHCGMTGRIGWYGDEARHRHDRAILVLDDGELRYRDQRKLRGLWLVRAGDDPTEITGRLGPDALGIARGTLRDLLARRRGQLKPALMDQELIAGLGNLVVDETLWQARLHPGVRAGDLGDDELSELHDALKRVLRDSVKAGRVPGKRGWLTGVRDDDPPHCPRCGATCETGRYGGRSTVWCPRDQPVS
jgi:formamidopyrimidine-DNA glycosylase